MRHYRPHAVPRVYDRRVLYGIFGGQRSGARRSGKHSTAAESTGFSPPTIPRAIWWGASSTGSNRAGGSQRAKNARQ